MEKKSLNILIALICGFALMTGCERQESIPEGYNNIVGCWAIPVYEYDIYPKAIICYTKVKALPANNTYCIKFNKDGTLIERKLAGWCATPPAVHENFPGNWRIENENELKIDVAYWGGMEYKTWKIINFKKNTLKIEIIVTDTRIIPKTSPTA